MDQVTRHLRVQALAAAFVLVACKHHDAPPAAAPPTLDWDACAAALAAPNASADKVLAACPVCGDWHALLDWSKPQADGGPKKMAIADAMAACDAWCDSGAKTSFLSMLDDVRGTGKRAPWKQLGETCKAAVSALPDSRFESAPYFALDRIARRASAHGGAAATAVGKLELPLPAASMSGWGVDLPEVAAATRPAPRAQVTLLGDQVYAGLLPRARFGNAGITVDFGGEPYPGKLFAPADLAAAIAELAPGALPPVALLAPRAMPTAKLAPVIDALRGKATLQLAVANGKVEGWPVPEVLARPIEDVGGAATMQDLANALAK